MSKKRKIFFFGVIFFVLLIFFSRNFLLDKIGSFLVVQDKLEKVDFIVVLGGEASGERIYEAARLYKEGFAPYIIISGGPVGWRLSHAEVMLRQALFLQIPRNKILLQKKGFSTYDEAFYTKELILKNRQSFKSLIVVTSPPHTRRSKLVFQKVFKDLKVKIMVYPVQKSEFKKEKWWLDHENTQFVIDEYMSLIFYWFKRYL